MHREYRPEDGTIVTGGGLLSAAGSRDPTPQERGLFLFTALLGALITCDLLLALAGWSPGWLLSGPRPVLAAAILGTVYVVYGALHALLQRRIGADFALAQAALAALVLGQPFVAAEVVFIALLGEVLEAWTFSRTRRALSRLIEHTPRTARVRRDGLEVEIPADKVAVGDRVIVRPGERMPCDGVVARGYSTVDQSTLTGEPLPVDKGPSDPVFTGTLNQYGVIEVDALKVGAETTFGQVLKLVDQARRRKATLEKTADRLARYFLPVVELAAGATLLCGYLAGWPDVWLRTVAVLVVACPCGLVLATPAAMLASMAWLARHGILIKGGTALEHLAVCDVFAFDKTGTLTQGVPRLAALVTTPGRDEREVLRLAASAENASHHPLGRVVVEEARRRGLALEETREASLLPGAGVRARCGTGAESDRQVLVGNRRLLAESGCATGPEIEEILRQLDSQGHTVLLVAIDGEVAGAIGVQDGIRPEAHDVIHELRHQKIQQIALLTGDREAAARAIARRIHADTVQAELLPADKASWIEERRRAGHHVAMVGDGINDAPALAQADAGIALGGIGADLAAEAGDFIMLGEGLRALPDLLRLSRGTLAIIRQNIIGFAFGLNAVAMLSAALGILGPVAAAILHQAGSLLVLLNSMRLLVFGEWAELPPFHQLRDIGARISAVDERIDLVRAWEWTTRRRRALLALACIALLAGYAASGSTMIRPGDVGVLQRLGRFRGILEGGLHLRWPYPIERVKTVGRDRMRSVEIGFRGSGAAGPELVRWESSHGRMTIDSADDVALLLTGDGRYVELAATLQFQIDATDPEALWRYVFDASDVDGALRPLAEAAVREIVGRRALVDLLTAGRAEAEAAAADLLAARIAAYRLGIVVRGITFQDIHPPLEVVAAYRDVSRATSDRQRRINEARAYHDRIVTEAGGAGQAIRQAALAARARRVALAAAGADAFNALRAARCCAPALSDLELYWGTLAQALAGKGKVILDDEPLRRRHLIMPGMPWEKMLPALSPLRQGEAAPEAAPQSGSGRESSSVLEKRT
jgi:Cu+-exporting ATPase